MLAVFPEVGNFHLYIVQPPRLSLLPLKAQVVPMPYKASAGCPGFCLLLFLRTGSSEDVRALAVCAGVCTAPGLGPAGAAVPDVTGGGDPGTFMSSRGCVSAPGRLVCAIALGGSRKSCAVMPSVLTAQAPPIPACKNASGALSRTRGFVFHSRGQKVGVGPVTASSPDHSVAAPGHPRPRGRARANRTGRAQPPLNFHVSRAL